MSDVEVVKAAIWVARDLSVRHNGEIPDEVRDAPLALQRLTEERDAAVTEYDLARKLLDENGEETARYREALERIAEGPYNGFEECKAIARAALTEETGLPPDIANISWKTSKITYDPMWAIQPKEEPS